MLARDDLSAEYELWPKTAVLYTLLNLAPGEIWMKSQVHFKFKFYFIALKSFAGNVMKSFYNIQQYS